MLLLKIGRSSNNWDIASHRDMDMLSLRDDPNGFAFDWLWQLGRHYGVPIWVCWIALRFTLGPSPIITVVWNFKLERCNPLITISSTSSLNLAHRHDVLECELIIRILISSIIAPWLSSIPCIVELTVHYSVIIPSIPYWRSRTGCSYGSP